VRFYALTLPLARFINVVSTMLGGELITRHLPITYILYKPKRWNSVEKQEVVVQEIEITPEMIEAGLDAMSDFECEYMGSEKSLVRAYEAMVRESLR